VWYNRRAQWRDFRRVPTTLAASATSSHHVPAAALLGVRCVIFTWCLFLLVQSVAAEGPDCLRFFTVWNFIVLTTFFGLGTVLSCVASFAPLGKPRCAAAPPSAHPPTVFDVFKYEGRGWGTPAGARGRAHATNYRENTELKLTS